MLKTYGMILSLLDGREKGRLAALLVLIVITGLLETAGVASILPFLAVLADPGIIETNRILSRIYQALGFTSVTSFQVFIGIMAFLMVVMGLAFRALTTYGIIRFTRMRSYLLSRRMLQNYLHQPYAWFLSRHSSQLSTGVLSEVENMISKVMMPAMQLLPSLVTAVMIAGLLLVMEPLVALSVVAVIGGASLLVYMVLRNALQHYGIMRKEANKARFRVVQESTGGIKELKLMGLEGSFLKRFELEAEWPLTAFIDRTNASEGTALGPFMYFVTLFTHDDEAVSSAFKFARQRDDFRLSSAGAVAAANGWE